MMGRTSSGHTASRGWPGPAPLCPHLSIRGDIQGTHGPEVSYNSQTWEAWALPGNLVRNTAGAASTCQL